MELPHIPRDDLMDVMEMTNTIELCIFDVLKENDRNLGMSALMGASINCILEQCETLDEVIFYRNLFMQILDSSIRTIQITGMENPSLD
jgi:hypothetical protein